MARSHLASSRSFLIDTNIFLELMFDQTDAAAVEQFFSLVERGKVKGYYTMFTLHSIGIMFVKQRQFQKFSWFLDYLDVVSHLQMLLPEIGDEREVNRIAQKYRLDYDDATQYHFANKSKSMLVSFDHHFDKTEVVRKEPKEIVTEFGKKS